jgi:transposase
MHIDKTCTEAQQRILSKEQVQEIFYATGLQREIAERFGVCKQTVSKIKRREHLYAKKLPAVRKAAE